MLTKILMSSNEQPVLLTLDGWRGRSLTQTPKIVLLACNPFVQELFWILPKYQVIFLTQEVQV